MTEMITKVGRHPVQVIGGDADGIRARGEEIENLGEQMIGAAALLKEIKDGITVEKGLSIERIQREVSNTHEELHLAGERYKPTGTAMKQYAEALSQVQTRMRTLVTTIADNEAVRAAAQRQLTTAQELEAQASSEYNPSDQSTVSRYWNARSETQDARTSLANCENTLDTSMGEFDQQWDTWDVAYEAAVSKVENATTGGVADSWTDRLADVVAVVVQVVGYIGIALVIASFFVTGPILAIIATVLAVIALAGTLYLAWKGRASGGDIAWAVVGILPFGKIAKALKAGVPMSATQLLLSPAIDVAQNIKHVKGINYARTVIKWGGDEGLYSAREIAAKLNFFRQIRRTNYIDDLMMRGRYGVDPWEASLLNAAGRNGTDFAEPIWDTIDVYSDVFNHRLSHVPNHSAYSVIYETLLGVPNAATSPHSVVSLVLEEGATLTSTARDVIDIFSGGTPDIEQWQAELRG